jgi:hypothetical protein
MVRNPPYRWAKSPRDDGKALPPQNQFSSRRESRCVYSILIPVCLYGDRMPALASREKGIIEISKPVERRENRSDDGRAPGRLLSSAL